MLLFEMIKASRSGEGDAKVVTNVTSRKGSRKFGLDEVAS
jgi:hypothetical protein